MYHIDLDNEPTPRVMGAAFGDLAKGFRTHRVPLEASIRRVAIPTIAENFIVGGKPPWQPHSDETVERRDREGTLGQEPQDILIETGQLFGDATKLARWTITGSEAVFSNLPNRSQYGIYHQTGTTHMPARPWATLDEDAVDGIENIFARWRDGIIVSNLLRRIRRVV